MHVLASDVSMSRVSDFNACVVMLRNVFITGAPLRAPRRKQQETETILHLTILRLNLTEQLELNQKSIGPKHGIVPAARPLSNRSVAVNRKRNDQIRRDDLFLDFAQTTIPRLLTGLSSTSHGDTERAKHVEEASDGPD